MFLSDQDTSLHKALSRTLIFLPTSTNLYVVLCCIIFSVSEDLSILYVVLYFPRQIESMKKTAMQELWGTNCSFSLGYFLDIIPLKNPSPTSGSRTSRERLATTWNTSLQLQGTWPNHNNFLPPPPHTTTPPPPRRVNFQFSIIKFTKVYHKKETQVKAKFIFTQFLCF